MEKKLKPGHIAQRMALEDTYSIQTIDKETPLPFGKIIRRLEMAVRYMCVRTHVSMNSIVHL
jgi:hypothetical protein